MKPLGMPDTRPTTDWLVTRPEFARRLKSGGQLLLVDLRDRSSYSQNHMPDAKNIPFDELDARAKNELATDETMVLYSDDDAVADNAYTILSRQGFSNVLILETKSTP